MPPEVFPRLMNAAGFGGWTCPQRWALDAFITNPLTWRARTPASPPRLIQQPNHLLLHTGHPNPGLRAALQHYAASWARSPIPVWVHLLADADLPAALEALEEAGCAAGLEVRLPADCDAPTARRIVQMAWRGTPLMVHIPFPRAQELADAVCQEDGVVISLGAAQGAQPLAAGGTLHGRLYSPSLYPLILESTLSLCARGLPVVACGAYTLAQAQALLAAGALGVQLDLPLWRELTFPAGW